MYTIYCDVPTTRRLKLSHVLAEDETVLFSAQSVSACIDWCADEGEAIAILRTAWRTYQLPLAYQEHPDTPLGQRVDVLA